MSTIERQCKRMLKMLQNAPLEQGQGFIPPQLLSECKGLMFFKKLSTGPQDSGSTGVLFKRETATGAWSLPTSIQFAQGAVSFPGRDLDSDSQITADLVILINDTRTIQAFQAFGQVGFDDQHHHCAKCPVVGGRLNSGTSDLVAFATSCSSDPFYLVERSFAFALVKSSKDAKASLYGCQVSDAILQVRDSSNQKYYNNKHATAQIILSTDLDLQAKSPLTAGTSRQHLDQTQECLKLLSAWIPKSCLPEQREHGLTKAELGITEPSNKQDHSIICPAESGQTHARRLSFTFQ